MHLDFIITRVEQSNSHKECLEAHRTSINQNRESAKTRFGCSLLKKKLNLVLHAAVSEVCPAQSLTSLLFLYLYPLASRLRLHPYLHLQLQFQTSEPRSSPRSHFDFSPSVKWQHQSTTTASDAVNSRNCHQTAKSSTLATEIPPVMRMETLLKDWCIPLKPRSSGLNMDSGRKAETPKLELRSNRIESNFRALESVRIVLYNIKFDPYGSSEGLIRLDSIRGTCT